MKKSRKKSKIKPNFFEEHSIGTLLIIHDSNFLFWCVIFCLYVVYCSIVAGKDFEGDKEFYSNAEWQERVEKWKVRQEKRGLLNKEDGKEDQAEEDDYLYVISSIALPNRS